MQIKIDQSTKIEYTSQNTVIAFSNHKQKSLLIKAKDKREIERIFRIAGKPYIFIYKTFAILIYLLIKDDLKEIQSIIIDPEYSRQEHLIKNFLLQVIRNQKKFFDKDRISFSRVGKRDHAHKTAIEVFRKSRKPDMVVSAKDLLPYVL